MGQISPIFFFHFYESSSTFTVPKGVKKIDVFCVGGGGYSGKAYSFQNPNYAYPDWGGPGGGGGGYTSTKLGVAVTPGDQIPVTVGAGGMYNSSNASVSSIGSICTANGGASTTGNFGCAGGSGGGGGYRQDLEPNPMYGGIVPGGTDGGDGSNCIRYLSYNGFSAVVGFGGKGQGTTTRYFGESNGTLYASGGWGCFYSNTKIKHGDANTGDGGNGSNFIYNGANGGSGICIIRWTKDYFK